MSKRDFFFSDCLWHRSCIPLDFLIYVFSYFLQVFKHQKVKKKAKPNLKKGGKPKEIGKKERSVASAPSSKTFFFFQGGTTLQPIKAKWKELILDKVVQIPPPEQRNWEKGSVTDQLLLSSEVVDQHGHAVGAHQVIGVSW